jgi:hypothetical protein
MAWGELRHAPVMFVHTAEREVTRIDMLTPEEARAVIVRLCDELAEARARLERRARDGRSHR